MNAGRYDFTVEIRKKVKRLIVISRDHLGNGRQGMLRISRVNALRRVTNGEVFLPSQSGVLLKLRDTNLFCCPRIDSGLIDHRRARCHNATDRAARTYQWAEVGIFSRINGRRHRDYENVTPLQV